MKIILLIAAVFVAAAFISTIWVYLIPVAVVYIIWLIYKAAYFKGKKFAAMKSRVQDHIQDCNDLNQHIEDLKSTGLIVKRTDYGVADYQDKSRWNFKRPELSGQKYAPYIYNCSRTVCDNARKEPFKYICKYFGVSATDENLSKFEEILNNFAAVEEGKSSLTFEREQIMSSISTDVPLLIRKFAKRSLEKNLGLEPVDFSTVYFPKYVFKYTSSGGNASTQCNVTMDLENLNKFVTYLSDKVKFSKSAAGQRALMTSKLRAEIKARDNYTCKICGASTSVEPHLLLEIDHIIPVSKGSMTAKDNLQTLCWKCNRSKGASLVR